MSDDNSKPVVRINSLSDLAPKEITVTLEFEDHIEELPMRTLGYAEVQRLRREVPDPVPPVIGGGKNGPVTDPKDPGYLQAVAEAEQRRMFKCIIAALALDVPGSTEDEKIAYLQSLGADYVGMMASALTQMIAGGRASLEAKSATFQRGRGKGR